jgi:hypothetical protein
MCEETTPSKFTWRDNLSHELMRRGINPFRCPNNYPRRWAVIWRAIVWYIQYWRDISFKQMFKSFLKDWSDCKDCDWLMNTVIETISSQCFRCWSAERDIFDNGECVWSKGFLRSHYVTLRCWLLGHNEKFECLPVDGEEETHKHIICLRCKHARWDSEPKIGCLTRKS